MAGHAMTRPRGGPLAAHATRIPAAIPLAALLLAASSIGAALAGDEPPPPATSGPKATVQAGSPWEAHTRTPAPQGDGAAHVDGTLDLTVYRGLMDGVTLPGRANRPQPRTPAYATDVTAIVTRCADGRQLITALVIGGRLTPLANRCDEPQGVRKPSTTACDANTWNCR